MGQFGFGQFGQRQMRNEDITIGCRITLREVYTGKNVLATYRLRNGQEQTVDIKLPPGVSPGDKIRYAGMGQKDIPNAPPGDLCTNTGTGRKRLGNSKQRSYLLQFL